MDIDLTSILANERPVQAQFSLKSREIACILGPSGIGKSTLLKFICDLAYPGDASSVTLHGTSYEKFNPTTWRRDVLYVHQGASKLAGTPQEFVETVESLKARRGLPRLDVLPFMEALGLSESFLDKPWDHFSGGEAQRMMVAISLSTKPPVILFDEPTSALDDAGKVMFEQLVSSLSWHCCILFVSHDESQVGRVASSVWRLVEK